MMARDAAGYLVSTVCILFPSIFIFLLVFLFIPTFVFIIFDYR